MFGGLADDNRAGPVAEDETVAAVGHIQCGESFSEPITSTLLALPPRIMSPATPTAYPESGAAGRQVEGRDTLGAQRGGHGRGRGRRLQVVRAGGDDHRVDLGTGQQGIGDRLAPGLDGQRLSGFLIGGEPPGFDAGAGVDPLV